MRPGEEWDLLIRVLGRLIDELPEVARIADTGSHTTLRGSSEMSAVLSAEQEALAISLRAALATLATTLGGARKNGAGETVGAALDGAEIVIRGELMTGRGDRLPRLLPSLVFVVTLPIVDQDRALALSQRTLELIQAQIEGS